MTAAADLKRNELLATLPAVAWERFAGNLEPVELRLGEVIYESGAPQPFVYFPTGSIISLLFVMRNGDSAEIAIVGNEDWSASPC